MKHRLLIAIISIFVLALAAVAVAAEGRSGGDADADADAPQVTVLGPSEASKALTEIQSGASPEATDPSSSKEINELIGQANKHIDEANELEDDVQAIIQQDPATVETPEEALYLARQAESKLDRMETGFEKVIVLIDESATQDGIGSEEREYLAKERDAQVSALNSVRYLKGVFTQASGMLSEVVNESLTEEESFGYENRINELGIKADDELIHYQDVKILADEYHREKGVEITPVKTLDLGQLIDFS